MNLSGPATREAWGLCVRAGTGHKSSYNLAPYLLTLLAVAQVHDMGAAAVGGSADGNVCRAEPGGGVSILTVARMTGCAPSSAGRTLAKLAGWGWLQARETGARSGPRIVYTLPSSLTGRPAGDSLRGLSKLAGDGAAVRRAIGAQ